MRIRSTYLRACTVAFATSVSVGWAGPLYGKASIRTTVVSESPSEVTRRISVVGQVATVLRFEMDVDSSRTRLDAWEGRFEPLLVGSKKVVLEPLHNLAEEEQVSLLVTLVDGTQFRFLVVPPSQDWPLSQQVDVFKDLASCRAVYSALDRALEHQDMLSEQNARLREEERSADHALARLLVDGQASRTALRAKQTRRVKQDGLVIHTQMYSGQGKAAAVVSIRNDRKQSWLFGEARLSENLTSGTERPFALHVERAVIAAGQAGRIVVVVDGAAFESERGLVDLILEIYKEDGERQLMVRLDHDLVR